jgi:hypothetical protein
MGRSVTLDIGRGKIAIAYLAEAADLSAPGIVVIKNGGVFKARLKACATATPQQGTRQLRLISMLAR